DLPGEDREREIPWRDAGEDAAPVKPDLIVLAGRAGQTLRRGELGAGARRVIPQEIDGFAHLRQGGRDRAPALADDQRHPPGAVALIEVRRLFQNRGSPLVRGVAPGRRHARRPGERLLDRVRPGGDNDADWPPPVAW